MSKVQRTLEPSFNFPSPKPRQFLAVLLKNFTLLYQSFVGMLSIFVVVIILSSVLGYLHGFYVANYKPSTSVTSNDVLKFPVEGSPANINFNIFASIANEKTLGTCTNTTVCTGYLAGFNLLWQGQNINQLRYQKAPLPNIQNAASYQSLYWYPYFTVKTTGYEDYAAYQAKAVVSIMEGYMKASIQPTPSSPPPSDWFNHTNTVSMYQETDMYSTGIFYTAFTNTNKVVNNYYISGYTSHQTSLGYGVTNFQRYCGTQYAMFQNTLRFHFNPANTISPPTVFGYYKQFWATTQDSGADPSTPIFQCFLLPLSFYLLIPIFAFQFSQEKGDGLISLQQMMGLRYYPRFYADFTFALIVAFVLGIIITAIYGGTKMELITSNSPVGWFFCFILFILNVPILSQLIASVTDSGRLSSIVAIIIILAFSAGGFMLVSQSYDSDDPDNLVNPWLSLVPGFGPVVQVILMSQLIVTQKSENFLTNDQISFLHSQNPSLSQQAGYNMAISLLISYLVLFLYQGISIYLDKITPRKNGIPEHPMFFLYHVYVRACVKNNILPQEISFRKGFWAIGQIFINPKVLLVSQKEVDTFLIKNRKDDQVEDEDSEIEKSGGSTTFDYLRGKSETKDMRSTSDQSQTKNIQKAINARNKLSSNDPDLANEKKLVEQNIASNGTKALVKLVNLKKTFPGTRQTAAKHAVKGIYYVVGENECLCLLGGNGCGKTTQINMISMLFKPTSGTAYVCGSSITDSSQKQQIQDNLGICPQFDILYPTMSIRQHLQFYAKIKGTDSKIESEHISDLLDAVELTQYSNKASKKLSGGMKRRLSIAIALCNRPKVLIFDEPSSGLDVSTRRQLWNVILKARTGRAILLTTHAMEEAECLSTRIAIMAEGKIRSIGAQQHLQHKFGTGYQLRICANKDKLQPSQQGVYVGSVYLSSDLEQQVHSKILDVSRGLILTSCYQGQMVYAVPPELKVSMIFGEMETLMKNPDSGISDWGLNQTSLESVFMKVVSNSY
ncbi:ABC transporter family protein [Spironucleus salmonicida]|uniref:ABC transporter family protein n=1 Tax=Spironucleus salmonicida TaxID=348837 RepID=V6LNH0_9EUKA|nr:ABC transporter family protein [Spironucleus salmonicida]|eukprot:EST45783.1 ABC transporter family protein [Spironucleus salmonicida]